MVGAVIEGFPPPRCREMGLCPLPRKFFITCVGYLLTLKKARGVTRNLFWEVIKVLGKYNTLILMFSYRFDVILPHNKVYLD